jgi:ankyrin repeat protein
MKIPNSMYLLIGIAIIIFCTYIHTRKNELLIKYVKNENQFVVSMLLKIKADPYCHVDNGPSAIELAIITDNLHLIKSLLNRTEGINSPTRYGLTILHLATTSNSVPILELIVNAGADLNKQDDAKRTALVVAIELKYPNCARYLLKKGSNPDLADSSGQNALQIAINNKELAIAKELIPYTKDINHRSKSQNTALHYAVMVDDSVLLHSLVDKGADMFALDHHKMTPVFMAGLLCQKHAVQILMELQEKKYPGSLTDSTKNKIEYVLKFGCSHLMKAPK